MSGLCVVTVYMWISTQADCECVSCACIAHTHVCAPWIEKFCSHILVCEKLAELEFC